MKKDIVVNLKLDKETDALLRLLADRYFDGNRSTTLRQLVKQEARARNIATQENEREAT